MADHPPRGASPIAAEPTVSSRLVTLPNALSVLRLFGVPVFLYLVLGPHADGLAIIVLMVSGATDYVDGKLARAWNQITRLGQLLDPLADRLYILATLYGLTARHLLPLWLALAIVGRDVLLATTLPVLRRHGYGPLQVSFLGKAATFNLLYAFPWLLGTAGHGWLATLSHPFAWAFTIWGSSLYWVAGGLYLVQVWQLVRADGEPPQGRVVAAGAPM
ncbi:MAG: CDP-alcohol phosphatidyltransferase family protein [Actinomycetota bacterium]|nr:CDP-alcohol phosphatidyltransferase family protein [Actinomycetota bacterium]